MSKDRSADELHKRMAELQGARKRKDRTTQAATPPDVAEVMSWIEPIVKRFVDEDAALDIQSADSSHLFVGYAFVTVCQIKVSAELSGVRIDLQGDGRDAFARALWLASPVDQVRVTGFVQNALLEWYQSLF